MDNIVSNNQATLQKQSVVQRQQKKQYRQHLFSISFDRHLLNIQQNFNEDVIINYTKCLQNNLLRKKLVKQKQFLYDMAISHLRDKSNILMDKFKIFLRINTFDSDQIKKLHKGLLNKHKNNQKLTQQITKIATQISKKIKMNILKKEQQSFYQKLSKRKILTSKNSKYESGVKFTALLNQRLDKLLQRVYIKQKASQNQLLITERLEQR